MIHWDDKFTAALISALVSGIISFTVSKKSLNYNNLQNKKENLSRRIEKVENIAVEYWSTSGRNIRDENYLKGQFLYLVKDIKLVTKNYDKLLDLLVTFRKIVTGGKFESANRNEDLSRVNKIQSTATSLRDLVQKC